MTEIDNRGRVKLSIKEAQLEEGTAPEAAPAESSEPEQEPEA